MKWFHDEFAYNVTDWLSINVEIYTIDDVMQNVIKKSFY